MYFYVYDRSFIQTKMVVFLMQKYYQEIIDLKIM